MLPLLQQGQLQSRGWVKGDTGLRVLDKHSSAGAQAVTEEAGAEFCMKESLIHYPDTLFQKKKLASSSGKSKLTSTTGPPQSCAPTANTQYQDNNLA